MDLFVPSLSSSKTLPLSVLETLIQTTDIDNSRDDVYTEFNRRVALIWESEREWFCATRAFSIGPRIIECEVPRLDWSDAFPRFFSKGDL